MTLTLALAGDTMLGRGVARRLPPHPHADALFSSEVRDVLAGADLVVLNLECCVSARGEPWPDPGKPFFFRAPPAAAGLLAELGVDCVTLANNHALDYGYEALLDTRALLEEAGVRVVGAGAEPEEASGFEVLETRGTRLAVIGVTDHPRAWAARPGRPGVAWADLPAGVPDWLRGRIGAAAEAADVVLVTPHWGPNMTSRPSGYVHTAAQQLLTSGATLVAGHSAHVFHGVTDRVLYDMGEFIDDYAVHPVLRNDLGLLLLVTFDDPLDGARPHRPAPVRLEALPIAIDGCRTRLADGEEWEWVLDRFTAACAELGTAVVAHGGRLVVDWS